MHCLWLVHTLLGSLTLARRGLLGNTLHADALISKASVVQNRKLHFSKLTVRRSKKIKALMSALIQLINSSDFACSSVVCPVFVAFLYLWLWHNKLGWPRWPLQYGQFAVPRKSSLALVTYDIIQLINSTVFPCSSVVCPVFIALLYLSL